MIRLCQPSPLLFQYVYKSDDWLARGVRSNPVRHIRPERRIGGRTRLTFPDLLEISLGLRRSDRERAGLTFPDLWKDSAALVPTG